MYQRKYALEIISETGLGAIKLAITPIDYNTKLTTKECDDIIKTNKLETITEEKEMEDHTLYQKLIGKLLYITMTRPNIIFSVQTLS